MIVNRSNRKRASNSIPSENYPIPEFEQGLKVVPEADLEHVVPFRQPEKLSPAEQQKEPKHSDNDRLSVHFNNIDNYLNELSAITAKIEHEQELIKRISGLKE